MEKFNHVVMSPYKEPPSIVAIHKVEWGEGDVEAARTKDWLLYVWREASLERMEEEASSEGLAKLLFIEC